MNKQLCSEFNRLVSPFIAGELTKTQADEFDAHLIECEKCESRYAKVVMAHSALLMSSKRGFALKRRLLVQTLSTDALLVKTFSETEFFYTSDEAVEPTEFVPVGGPSWVEHGRILAVPVEKAGVYVVRFRGDEATRLVANSAIEPRKVRLSASTTRHGATTSHPAGLFDLSVEMKSRIPKQAARLIITLKSDVRK